MQTLAATDSREWNECLAAIPCAHVLQSWEWGELKSRYGWAPSRLIFSENGGPNAAAQILRRHLPRSPYGVLYVPKGPALEYSNTSHFNSVLEEIEQFARRQRAIFVKIDPDIRIDIPAASILSKRGWRVSKEQIQFRNTVMLDLKKDEEQLLAAMKSKWRYNIRLAEKKGVRVEVGTESDLPLFFQLYAETSARDGFLIREFPYYRDVWSIMLRAGLAQILFARLEAETIAGLILFAFASRAWYFYGASRNAYRELMPNHLLQWEAIRWAKQRGCTTYDFWGAPDRLEESEPMYGLYKFKQGFGGEFVERIPAHDYIVNPVLYWLYAVVRPWYLARLAGKRNLQSGFE